MGANLQPQGRPCPSQGHPSPHARAPVFGLAEGSAPQLRPPQPRPPPAAPPPSCGSPSPTPTSPPAHRSLPRRSHPHSCPRRHTGAQSTGRRGRSCIGRAGWEDTRTGLWKPGTGQGQTWGAPALDGQPPSPPRSVLNLTAFLRVLIRVIPAVVLAVTLPGQGLAQGVVTLKLIQGAGPHWVPGEQGGKNECTLCLSLPPWVGLRPGATREAAA